MLDALAEMGAPGLYGELEYRSRERPPVSPENMHSDNAPSREMVINWLPDNAFTDAAM
jgi:hypothetical protein